MKRFGGILTLFLVLGGIVVARLFQVQVLEHELWAGRAARLVRSGREEPYRRGRILDARGRVLARDAERRSVVLVYRDFRRSHPLGLVAHARSLLAGRPVSLTDTCARLVDWTRELLLLRPRDLAAFAAGEPVEGHPELTPGAPRPGRAADLAFYLRNLLGLDAPQWSRVEARAREEPGHTFLELAAEVRRGAGERGEEEWLACESRLRTAMNSLEVLARWLLPPGSADSDPLRHLVSQLEDIRRGVEDATAAKLFAEATGFAPGRLEARTLLECFDHAWLNELLVWDSARLAEWTEVVRAGWLQRWRDEVCVPRLLWTLVLDPPPADGHPPLDAFLDRLLVVYRPEGALAQALGPDGPPAWRTVEDLVVFDELSELFEARPSPAVLLAEHSALPTMLADMRVPGGEKGLFPPGQGPGSTRERLQRALASRRQRDVEVLIELAGDFLERWELRFQETLRRALDGLRAEAREDERGLRGGLLLDAGSRARAAERADFYLMDYGMRPTPLSAGELSYDVVYLLTRYAADFPGFQVRESSVREPVELSGDDARPAERIVGDVSAQSLADVLRQRDDMARYRELKAAGNRDEGEEEELERLIGALRLPDEVKGISGIEGYYEPELSGTNGFVETRGLADLVEASGDEIVMREPVDGQDVTLTIDADLMAAVQRSLRHPDEADEKEDAYWRRHPVGAVVLLTAEGDVLAAASEPDDQSVLDPDAQQQRLLPIERTLRKPTFQPPGSVFKVFVAAWALDNGLDPERTVVCGPIERGGSGYKNLRCWNTYGHGEVNLEQAIERSCNAYFAWLGETLSASQFAELAEVFGFGEPTGVRRAPPWAPVGERRIGLFEDLAGLALGEGRWPEQLRHMAGNGLAVVEATPMQLARATLALGSGAQRELRLVQRIGEHDFPRSVIAPLAISRSSLERVRGAMQQVAAAPQGTAHAAMAPAVLGLDVALKTGSADLENRKDEEGHTVVYKHAWVAGWVPARDPKLVFVVFQHRTRATSSHGAVYLARQVLWQPEVLAWLASRGVDVSRVPER